MIIVHDIFVAKPGNASKLAKMFKEATKESPDVKNILTDMTGAYNRVIMVTEYENLGAYEKNWDKMKENPEAMKNWKALIPSRKKEILRYFSRLKSPDARARNLARALHVLSGETDRFMARTWKNGS